MVNGLLLRPYMSGMVWDMGEESLKLMREGIALYKKIRNDIKVGVPVFPLGFTDTRDDVLAYAVKTEEKTYLAVFTPRTDRAEILLAAAGIIYTIGGIIYALKVPIFNAKHKNFGSHEIFHLFVMGGSACHFVTMFMLA